LSAAWRTISGVPLELDMRRMSLRMPSQAGHKL
jgi:hypothetical protein